MIDETTQQPIKQPIKPMNKRPQRKKLTWKQEMFAKKYVELKGNGSRAAMEVYDARNENVAHVIASENLQKPTILEKIKTLQQQFVEDSFYLYDKQIQLLHSTKDEKLQNQIINKTLDRAGFMPVKKSENKTMHAKFIIKRG